MFTPEITDRLRVLADRGIPPIASTYLTEAELATVANFLAGYAPDAFLVALDYLPDTPEVAEARRLHTLKAGHLNIAASA